MINKNIRNAIIAYKLLSKDEKRIFRQNIDKIDAHTSHTSSGNKNLGLLLNKKSLIGKQHATAARDAPQGTTINFGPRPKRDKDNEDEVKD